MTDSEWMPTTQNVEDAFSHDPEAEYRDPVGYGAEVARARRVFRKWLAARDAEVARAAAEKAWREGWDAGFRDYQGARQDDDGYLVITPRPNPHRLEQTDD